jgi:hypothetical protein
VSFFAGFIAFIGMIVMIVFVLGLIILPFALLNARARELRAERKRNLAAPVLTSYAKIVGEREQITGGNGSVVRQTHYATFEFSDGNRIELVIPANEAGLITTGDQGQLTWKGSWYQGFTREILR